MSNKIAIMSFYGMGSQTNSYYDILYKELENRFSQELDNRIKRVSVDYHTLFNTNQSNVWARMKDETDLDCRRLREFMLKSFSDAVTTEHMPEKPDSLYLKIQKLIKEELDGVIASTVGEPIPVIIFAYSLGCEIISNYIWDAQHCKGIWTNTEPTPFQSLETCSLMFTCGCNIPLFVSGLDKIQSFARPNPDFKWFNYYDKDDILGWPLKPLNKPEDNSPNSYQKLVTKDIAINTGWNPLSHSDYWTDKHFLDPVANKIKELYSNP